MLRASRDFEILARNKLDARFLASPVVSKRQIFLRSDDNELICSAQDSLGSDGRIRCRERLGGTLRYYYRDAA